LSGLDRWLIGGFSTVALAIVVTMLVRIGAVEPDQIHFAPENSIAVLPFEVCGGHAVDKKLGFQLPMEILNRLSEHPTFKVIAQTSSYKLAGFGWSKPRIAKQLGVEYILSGEVCRDGEALTITAELRDKDDFIVQRETYTQVVNRFDQIEQRVASLVADGVATELGDVVQLAPDAPVNRLAYEQYLIALELKRSNDFDQALIAIEKALELQPDFAMAMLERAFILVRPNRISHKTPTAKLESLIQISKEALDTINRQLETGKNSGHLQHVAGEINLELGHLNNAWIIHQGKMLDEQAVAELKEASIASFQRSERHHRSSIALRYPSALSYLHLGDSLEHLGGAQRRDEALQIYERGLELDPFHKGLNTALAKRWSDRGRYRQGIELLERFMVLPDVPDAIWWWMGGIHADHGYLVEYCTLNLELLLNVPGRPGLNLFFFLQVLEQLGLEEEADEWYERLRKVPREPEWRYEQYLLHTEQQDQIIEKWLASSVADKSDEEILDRGPVRTREASWLLARSGEYERAIELLELLWQLTGFTSTWNLPNAPEEAALVPMGLVELYYQTGRSDEAIPLLEETVKYLEAEYNIGIRHPQTLYLLAEAYAYQGQDEAALEMLEKAVDYHARWPVLNAADRL
jgi:tetratricopeptide (TPR) repeat protein